MLTDLDMPWLLWFILSKRCRSNGWPGLLPQAPEFVRKHILNKHGDKVTAVRQEVEFFNNFLLDAKRPALPENKPPPPPVQGEN